MLIASRQAELSGDDLVGLRVPADDGLGASAAGRTTDIQNLLSDLAEIAAQCPAGVLDEMRHVERHNHGRTARLGDGRLEFKSAHRATAAIHKTLQRRDLFGPSSMPSQVLIDERVAEFIRERVSQEARQAVKSVLSQSRKAEPLLGLQRHA